MRNRAKCRKCNCIIESINPHDWIYCSCSEIGLSGGKDSYKCYAGDFSNFLRVDDENNEIIVKVKESTLSDNGSSDVPTLERNDLLNMLDEMIKSIEGLPEHAKLTAINHYDHSSLLYLLAAIFRSK